MICMKDLKILAIIGLIILPILFLQPKQTISQQSVEQLKTPETPSNFILEANVSKEFSGFFRRYDISTNQVCVNQICDYYLTQYFRPATTTPCNIELPRATTTPLSMTISAAATSSPIIWTIATSTTLNATTSLIYEIANSRNQVVATTTVGTSPASGVIFGSVNKTTSQYLVFGAKGGQPGGANTFVNGVCKVHLREL